MPKIISVCPLDGYRLEVVFDDGTRGVVPLEDRLFGSMFEPLHDWALFSRVFVDDFRAIAWLNGADLAPDAIHQRLRMAAEVA